MIFEIYLATGLAFGLWASKRVYRTLLNDVSNTEDPINQGFSCAFSLVSIVACTFIWPLILVVLAFKRFLWTLKEEETE